MCAYMKLTIPNFLLCCVLSTAALVSMAQSNYTGKPAGPVAGEPALSMTEIKARYQNCELGYYHGAKPGKVRYVKDRYIRAVTPEFARKFCMPQEFVSNELKDAESVAFKLAPGGFGENCGFGGKSEFCAQGVDLRFEIYISRDVKLPVKNEVDFTAPRHGYYSYSLIGHSKRIEEISDERAKSGQRAIRSLDRFETNAFGLAGIQGNKVVWPLTTLYLDEYRGKLYDGSIDYIAVQGQTGNFKNHRMLKEGIQDFSIQMLNLGHKGNVDGLNLEKFAHVIYLPRAFAAQVQAMDLGEGTDWEALAKRALMPSGTDK